MIGREVVDWMAPADEWERTKQAAREKYGNDKGSLSRFVDNALREYAGVDGGLSAADEDLREFIEATGLTPRDEEEKNSLISKLTSQPTTRVQVRVTEEAVEEFRKKAKESDQRIGIVFGRALNEYRDGGRAGSISRRVDRITESETAETAAKLSNPDADEPSTDELKKQRIIAELDDAFSEADLEDAISEHAGHSPPTIRTWSERVLDELDVEPHPNREDAWVPVDYAATLLPDGLPRESRQPVEMLSESELVTRIRMEAALYAACEGQDGMAEIPLSLIRERVLDGGVGEDRFTRLIGLVAEAPGFGEAVRDGRAVLVAHAGKATGEDVLDADRLQAYGEDPEAPGLLRQDPGPSADASDNGSGQPGAADGGDWF